MLYDSLQKPHYVRSIICGMTIGKQGCEYQSELLHITFGSSHFQLIQKFNQSMSIIIPTKNLNYEIIDQDMVSNQEDNDLHSQNIWKQSHESPWEMNVNYKSINS